MRLQRVVQVLVALCAVLGVKGQRTAWPGTRCSSDAECDHFNDNPMTCDASGHCNCDTPKTFDYNEEDCRLPFGAQCESATSLGELTPNSECTDVEAGDLVVQCKSSYPLTAQNKCARSHDGDCSGDDHCDRDIFLTCDPTGGKCKCNDGSTFHQGRPMCYKEADVLCDAAPPTGTPGPPLQECNLLSSCAPDPNTPNDYKCLCNPGMTKNRAGECAVDHGDPCDRTTPPMLPCDVTSHLACSASAPHVCECRNPFESFYDNSQKTCRILVNGQCEKGAGSQGCVEHAHCQEFSTGPGAGNSYCLCGPTLFPSKEGQCYLPYGQPCSGGLPCNPELNHQCLSGSCSCPADSWFDPSSQSCLLFAGAKCPPSPAKELCGPNSNCMPTSAGTGICTCKDGGIPNAEHKCFLSYGATCSTLNPICDTNGHMECNAGTYKCDCASLTTSVYENGKCRIKANAECSADIGRTKECVEHALCSPNGPTNHCTCTGEDLVGGIAGKCVRRHGSACGAGLTGACDADAHEQCLQGSCSCSDPLNMNYNGTDGRCYLRMNSTCSAGNGISCEPTLACVSGTCTCDPALGLVLDGAGKCVKSFGAPCSSSAGSRGGCNGNEYLDCIGNTCKCDRSYTEVKTGSWTKCVGSHRAACKTSANCNRNASLTCDANFYCECSTTAQVYDTTLQKCYSSLAGPCHVTSPSSGDQVPLNCHPDEYLICEEGSEPNVGKCACDGSEFLGYCSSAAPTTKYSFALFSILLVFPATFYY